MSEGIIRRPPVHGNQNNEIGGHSWPSMIGGKTPYSDVAFVQARNHMSLAMISPRDKMNCLHSEVRKLFSQSCTDVPAQLPSAMLPRQARGTCKKTVIQTSETVHFVSWYRSCTIHALFLPRGIVKIQLVLPLKKSGFSSNLPLVCLLFIHILEHGFFNMVISLSKSMMS